MSGRKPPKIEVVAAALEAIVKKEGTITRERVVELAEKKDHPLHQYFEWDDSKAAYEYRLQCAYDMMRTWDQIKTFKNPQSPTLVTNAHVRSLLPTGNPAKPFEMTTRAAVFDDKEMRRLFIMRKIAELYSWCDSVPDVKDLTELREGLLKLLTKFEKG
jgi:hypothetical protein